MKIIVDIKELWQDCKETLAYTYLVWTDPKIAPPSIRTIDVGFVTLLDHQQRHYGCFVAELYELAKIGGLRAQQQERAWIEQNPSFDLQSKKQQPFYHSLYHGDDTPKTPFELSVLPIAYSDEDKRCTQKIQKHLEKEFNYRIKRNQPLAPVVFKYQIQADYLKFLHLLNLNVGNARSLKLNILNPQAKTPLIERMSHYAAQRAALILTLLTLLSISIVNPYLFSSTVICMILGKWCSDEFSTYGLVETLLRDIKSLFAKEFRWGDKISLKKTIKTLVLLGALSVYAYFGLQATWSTITGYAFWNNAGALLGFTKYLLAGFASLLGAISTFVSGTVAQRYFWGLSIWDKHIDFTKEKPLSSCQGEKFESKLNKWQTKLHSFAKKQNLSGIQLKEFNVLNETLLHHFKSIKTFLIDINKENNHKPNGAIAMKIANTI
ncbi:MAG: hypothetical protein JSS07_08960 [Proteobacteria bacterium]|nr:hypothetical protein [Pseudomonadota bacterium]